MPKMTRREIEEAAFKAAVKVYVRELRRMRKKMRELFDDDDDDLDPDEED